MEETLNKGYKVYSFNEYEKRKLQNNGYVLMDNFEGSIKDLKSATMRYKTFDVFEGALDNLKNSDVSLNELILNIKDVLTDIEYSNQEDIELPSGVDYLKIYAEKTKEIENSNSPVFYTFPSHPLLKENLRMEKGQFGSLISKTGNGKSILAVFLAVDFAKSYENEEVIFITDENSASAIFNHMHSHYFKLPTRDIQDRTIKIDEYIKKLPTEEQERYYSIFKRIKVYDLPGIPLDKVKNVIKKNEKTGLVIVDSFDEVQSLIPMYSEELSRYDRNAKLLEAMAKELGVIILSTAQLGTQYYTTCASKLPEICNFNSKTLVKKNFFAIVLHYSVDNSGAVIDDVIRVVKNRNGMANFSYKVTKEYSKMQLVADNSYYDYNNLKQVEESNMKF